MGAPRSSSPRRTSLPLANHNPSLECLQRSSASASLSIAPCRPQWYPGPRFPDRGVGAGRAPSRARGGRRPPPHVDAGSSFVSPSRLSQGPPEALRMLGSKQLVAFRVAWPSRGPRGERYVSTSDASHRQLPPSSSSCYHSNVWELQSWTKTPLNSLKWSNSTAPALTGLLSLQMDILYLATSNVSIWALIFHGEQLLFWCSAASGQTAAAGEPSRRNPPQEALSLWGGQAVL